MSSDNFNISDRVVVAIPKYENGETNDGRYFSFWNGMEVALSISEDDDDDEQKVKIEIDHHVFKGHIKFELLHILNLELEELINGADEVSEFEDSILPQLTLYKEVFEQGVQLCKDKIQEVENFITENS
jgi:hypothetical protein